MIVHRDPLHVLYINTFISTYICTCIYNERKTLRRKGPAAISWILLYACAQGFFTRLYVNTHICTYICTCIYNKRKSTVAKGPSGNLLDTPI